MDTRDFQNEFFEISFSINQITVYLFIPYKISISIIIQFDISQGKYCLDENKLLLLTLICPFLAASCSGVSLPKPFRFISAPYLWSNFTTPRFPRLQASWRGDHSALSWAFGFAPRVKRVRTRRRLPTKSCNIDYFLIIIRKENDVNDEIMDTSYHLF